jgi:hypothetical protein
VPTGASARRWLEEMGYFKLLSGPMLFWRCAYALRHAFVGFALLYYHLPSDTELVWCKRAPGCLAG